MRTKAMWTRAQVPESPGSSGGGGGECWGSSRASRRDRGDAGKHDFCSGGWAVESPGACRSLGDASWDL